MVQRSKKSLRVVRQPTLAILIPAYNESERLPATLSGLTRAVKEGGFSPFEVAQVVVADDGSTDDTAEVARAHGQQLPAFAVHTFPHTGKGGAIKNGWRETQADWVLIGDADLINTWYDAGKMAAKALEQQAVIAIGSRGKEHSTFIVRHFTGKLFNFLTRKILKVGFEDTQCGFKLFHRETLSPYFEQLTSLGFAWDVEILYQAYQSKSKVVTLPVHWEDHPGSKVRVVRDGVKMVMELIRIRFTR